MELAGDEQILFKLVNESIQVDRTWNGLSLIFFTVKPTLALSQLVYSDHLNLGWAF